MIELHGVKYCKFCGTEWEKWDHTHCEARHTLRALREPITRQELITVLELLDRSDIVDKLKQKWLS